MTDEQLSPELIGRVMASLGKRGGQNSRKNLTPAKKKALAKKAARARWGKKKPAK